MNRSTLRGGGTSTLIPTCFRLATGDVSMTVVFM